MGNKVIYDWVSVTSKIHSPDGLIRLLGLDHDGIAWEQVKGAHGYRDRLYWEKISIHYNGREDMGIWLEMSGQGCRAFESFGSGDYEGLFQEVFSNPGDMHITRLDVVFDDLEGLLDIEAVCGDARKAEYVSKFRTGAAIYGWAAEAARHWSVFMTRRRSAVLTTGTGFGWSCSSGERGRQRSSSGRNQ